MSSEKKDVKQPASPYSRLMQTSNFYYCVITVMGFATPIDAEHFKESVRQNLIKHPRFSSLLVLEDKKRNKMSWKPTTVNVDNHVFMPDISPELESGDRFVEDFISTITKAPMDLSKPLWEMHLLNVKTTHAISTAVFRFHHSLGDGVSLMSVLLACSKRISDPESLPILPSTTKRPVPRSNKGMSMMSLIWRVMLIVYYTLIDVMEICMTMIWYKDSENPLKSRSGSEECSKRYVHRVLEMKDIKIIKNSMHVTVNDVLFGIMEAALSSYVFRKYENNAENEVTKLRIRGLLTFNMRPSATIEDMSQVMEKGKKLDLKMWGNMVGFVTMPLKLRLEEDPLNYIRRAKATMDRKKLSYQSFVEYHFVRLLIYILGIERVSWVLKRTFSHLTFGVSNMVGPREEISLFDHPLNYLAPTVTGVPTSTVIHFQSYSKKLIIFMAIDEKLFPNPDQLCEDFQNSIQSIRDAALRNPNANSH